MTLQEFLNMNTNGNYKEISLYNDIKYIDTYNKIELKDSIYLNRKVKSFEVASNGWLHIEIE